MARKKKIQEVVMEPQKIEVAGSAKVALVASFPFAGGLVFMAVHSQKGIMAVGPWSDVAGFVREAHDTKLVIKRASPYALQLLERK